MVTVLSVVGTRPEAIKMAPVLEALACQPNQFQSVLCVTGQHRELLDPALDLFGIVPDFNLAVMQPNQSLSQLTARLMGGLDEVVQQVRPDWILAQGDTTSVLVASIVAYYHRIGFGHVEAGLRTGNRWEPFPEEMNRRVVDVIADLHFAPTEQAREVLIREGISAENVYVTGNTVIDALLKAASVEPQFSNHLRNIVEDNGPIILITAHRRESFGKDLRSICLAVCDLAEQFQNHQFIYPMHLNPNVRRPVLDTLSGKSNIALIEPVNYYVMVQLMKRAKLILTDSGGIQEEAPALGVPVLVMRSTTERMEAVASGAAKLVGTRRSDIVENTISILTDATLYSQMARPRYPFGDGNAAQRIVSIIRQQKRQYSDPNVRE